MRSLAPLRIYVRLSSLGDVILSTASIAERVWQIQEHSGQEGVTCEQIFLTSTEYAALLKGNPKLDSVIGFDRSSGLLGWIKIWWSFSKMQRPIQVVDLHLSLRTGIARCVFELGRGILAFRAVLFGFGVQRNRLNSQWTSISKDRATRRSLTRGRFARTKKMSESALSLTPWVDRYREIRADLEGQRPKGSEPKTDLRYLIPLLTSDRRNPCAPGDASDVSEMESWPHWDRALAVMPSSKWAGKCYPLDLLVEVLTRLGCPVVVLGAAKDLASVELVRRLEGKLPVLNGTRFRSLRLTLFAISRSRLYLGNDTGFAHLAEALAKPAIVLFGPTSPALGFGPWRTESRALASGISCQPCDKEGRTCHLPGRPFTCWQELSPARIEAEIRPLLS